MGSDEDTGDSESTPAGDDIIACPECGKVLPAGARFCPHCASDLTDDDSAVDLSALDGIEDFEGLEGFDPGESLLSTDEAGRRRASGRIRVVAGLAVAIPLAPIVLFLASSVLSLTLPTALLVLLAGWLCPAAYLSRARVPAEAFGRSLYLVAAGTVLVPVALSLRPESVSDGPLTPGFGMIVVVAMVIAGLCVLLGTFVRRQASRRSQGTPRMIEEGGE